MLLLCSVKLICNMEFGQSTCFPLEENGVKRWSTIKRDHSIPCHMVDEPIRESDCEVMLPLTFDEVASLLIRPRGGERRRFMSLHDSNTIIRHRASLSEGERAGWECGGAETQHDTDNKTEGCANIWILTNTNTKKNMTYVDIQTNKHGRQKNQGWRFWF